MIADLAIAPYPLSLVKPPLKRLDEGPDLPTLGDYQIKLLRAADRSEPAEELSRHVIAALNVYRK